MRMEGRRDAGRGSDAIGRALSSPSLCTSIVWAATPLSRMRFATPNGVSLTGAPPPRRCSAQESEGEENKTGEQISVDSDRPSHGRVRYAAPKRRALDSSGPFRRVHYEKGKGANAKKKLALRRTLVCLRSE